MDSGQIQISEYGEAVVHVPIGRCCNFTDQICLDGVTLAECDAQVGRTRFVEGETCEGVDCIPTDGACCDRTPGRGGVCTLREEFHCPNDGFHEFTLNTECEDVVCEEATGACCHRFDRSCRDGLYENECTGINKEWYADTQCHGLVCPVPPEATPAVSEWGAVVLTLSFLVFVTLLAIREEVRDVS
jgi:hypothetical protein